MPGQRLDVPSALRNRDFPAVDKRMGIKATDDCVGAILGMNHQSSSTGVRCVSFREAPRSTDVVTTTSDLFPADPGLLP